MRRRSAGRPRTCLGVVRREQSDDACSAMLGREQEEQDGSAMVLSVAWSRSRSRAAWARVSVTTAGVEMQRTGEKGSREAVFAAAAAAQTRASRSRSDGDAGGSWQF